jgi:hypothetical protein
MSNEEKAFIYGSILVRVEEEKKHAPKNIPKKGRKR